MLMRCFGSPFASSESVELCSTSRGRRDAQILMKDAGDAVAVSDSEGRSKIGRGAECCWIGCEIYRLDVVLALRGPILTSWMQSGRSSSVTGERSEVRRQD